MNGIPRHYSWFQLLIQKIAATRAGAWFFARVAHRLDKMYLMLSSGHIPLAHIVSGLPVMVMTTTGARSGLPRSTPLVYINDPGNTCQIAVVGSNLGQHSVPGWYYNLKANPHVTCLIDGKAKGFTAHEAAGEEYAKFWRYSTETYFGYSNYKKLAQRHIPIMILTEYAEHQDPAICVR